MSNFRFRVEDDVDYGDEVIEAWDAEHQDQKKPRHGVIRYVIVTDTDNNPVEFGGVDREAYFKEQLDPVSAPEAEFPELKGLLGPGPRDRG